MIRKHRRTKGTVRVLGRNIKITAEAREGLLGWFSENEGVINVAPGQTDFDTKDTFLHEVMHAILSRHGSRAGEGGKHYLREEAFVLPVSTGLIQFFRDNPAAAQWIISSPEAEYWEPTRSSQKRKSKF